MRNSIASACWTQPDKQGPKSTVILHVCCTLSRVPMPKRRSFGQLRRLPSKRWQAFYTGPDTALHYAPHTFNAKMDAEAWLVDERRIITSGAWTPPDDRHHTQITSTTLAAYAAPWLADRSLKPRTREHYQSLLDRQIVPSLGAKPLNALTPAV